MIPATCPCCESAGPMHKRGCTFFKDCPDECMDFDDMARLRAEIARLRLTDAEREAVQWSIEVADSLAECSGAGTGGEPSREASTLRALLARLGGAS